MSGHVNRRPAGNEEGFVLVLALVLLLLLTLFGLWALNSSDFESRVARNAQQAERQFHVAEAANYTEAAKLGYYQRKVYDHGHPDVHNQILVPDDNDFDPIRARPCTVKKDNKCSADEGDPTTWPWANLEGKTRNDADRNILLDYRYLVTYLYPDTPPKGYAADQFDFYKYRVMGNAPRTGFFSMGNPGRTVETAGGKVRAKDRP